MSKILIAIDFDAKRITQGIEEVSIRTELGSHKVLAEILLLTDIDIKDGKRLTLHIGFEKGIRKFNLNTMSIHTASSGKKRIFASSIGYQLDDTFICESYNDETAVAVIKRLLSKAEFTDIVVNIENVSIPHIIFNNIRLTEAIKRVLRSVTKHNRRLPYIFTVDDKISIVDKLQPGEIKERFLTGQNIISHEVLKVSKIEAPLTINLNLLDTIKIEDNKKSINGLFQISAIEHTVKSGVGRTLVAYL